jgi:GAF domain-containing protein
LEDTHLRLATNQDQIREGEVLSEIHAVMRRVAQASTFSEAATALILGSAALIGNQPVTLAVYQPAGDLLRMVITAISGRIVAGEGEPLPVAALAPTAFQAAFREGQPYYVRHAPIDELTPDARRRALASGVQSVYGHPLIAGSEVVGLLVVTSRRVDGISPEAQAICAKVAGIVGPAMAYFVARDQRPAA